MPVIYNRSVTGTGESDVLTVWDSSKKYSKDAKSTLGAIQIVANGDIPPGTTFKWGTTGATWRADIPQCNWLGVVSALPGNQAFAINDVVALGETIDDDLQILRVATSGLGAAGLNGGSDAGDWVRILPRRNGTNGLFGFATSAHAGFAGLVPQPPKNGHLLPLTGKSGFWGLHFGTMANNTPAEPGSMAYDANYLYIAIGTNTWRRVALSTF